MVFIIYVYHLEMSRLDSEMISKNGLTTLSRPAQSLQFLSGVKIILMNGIGILC